MSCDEIEEMMHEADVVSCSLDFQHRRCSSVHNSVRGITYHPSLTALFAHYASAHSNSVLTFPYNISAYKLLFK